MKQWSNLTIIRAERAKPTAFEESRTSASLAATKNRLAKLKEAKAWEALHVR